MSSKTVGRRRRPHQMPAEAALQWQDTAARTFADGPLCDRGVFRFSTFEEAERWRIDQRVKNHLEHQRRRTSRESPAL